MHSSFDMNLRDPGPSPSRLEPVAPRAARAVPTPSTPEARVRRANHLPPAFAKPLSVLSLVQSVRRRWVLAFSLAVAAAVLTAVVTWLMLPPSRYSAYTARATLEVRSMESSVIPTNPPRETDFGNYRGTVVARVKGPVLQEVLDRDDIRTLGILAGQPDPLEFLRSEVQADYATGPEALRITLSGENPKDLAAIVNAVAETAVKQVSTRERKRREERLEHLTQAQRSYEESLSSKRLHLKKLSEELGVPIEQSHMAVLNAQFSTLRLQEKQAQLIKVESERRAAEAMVVARKARPRNGNSAPSRASRSPLPSLDEALKGDPIYQRYITRLNDLEERIRDIRATAVNPEIARQLIKERRIEQDIEMSQEALRVYRERLQNQSTREPVAPGNGDAAANLEDLEDLELRIRSYQAMEDRLNKDIEALAKDTAQIKKSSAEMESIQDEIRAASETNREVSKWMEMWRVELLAPDRVTLLEKARPPVTREERRTKFAGLTGFGAFAMVLFAVGFLEFRTRRVHLVDEVARGLEIPVVGTQPILPGHFNPLAGSGAVAGLPWHSLPNENVDALRAQLLQPGADGPTRVVLVAGSVGGEGATTLAVQLAASMARSGRRTLLIDANLRRPAAFKALGVPGDKGLSDVLRCQASVDDVIRPTGADRLFLMPSGQGDLLAIQGLGQERVQAILDQVRSEFEFVCIDGAPVLPVADALLLAQKSDAVLLSVLCGQSRQPTVYAAWRRLVSLGAHVLGAVVQGAPDDVAGEWNYSFAKR